MNSNQNKKPVTSITKTKMMRSAAFTILLVHIMYISFARGFLITTHTSSSSSSLHPHILQASTRQNELLTSRRSKSQPLPTTTPSSNRRRTLPPPPSPTNNNQYTQFFKENVLVGIQRTSSNSRRISGEMIMNIPIDVIWSIISDYDNLAVHVPNLVESTVINKKQLQRRRGSGTTPPRVYQRGAQRIFGFEFGADVTMDMTEHMYLPTGSEEDEASSSSKQYVIDFKCVDSQFFSEFDGSWIVEEYNGDGDASSSVDGSPITMVRYVVDVRPKGPVPVAALEWRIKEDVPVNILAVSKAASSALARQQAVEQRQRRQTSTENNISRVSPSNPQDRKQSRASLFPRRQSQRLSRSQRSTSPRPLQRLTDQATNNIKRTAKAVLPSPMYSTAKQAVNILNNNLPRPRRNDVVVTSTTSVQASSSDSGNGFKSTPTRSSGGSGNIRKDTDVDWYDDETMAMYL